MYIYNLYIYTYMYTYIPRYSHANCAKYLCMCAYVYAYSNMCVSVGLASLT